MALRPSMIEAALRRLTGDTRSRFSFPGVVSVQKKGQPRIWRIAGTSPRALWSFQRDGSEGALLTEGNDIYQRITSVEELRAHVARLKDRTRKLDRATGRSDPPYPYVNEWEWAVLADPEAQTKLERWIEEACGQPVDVAIGSESTFPTSIIVRLKPAEQFKTALARTLFEALPPRGSVWPLADRKRWLDAASALFDMTYKR